MRDKINKFFKTKYFVPLLLVVALAMRLVAINQSLWLDEAIGAIIVRDYSYKQILVDFLRSDNHPPLYYLDLKSWTSVLGYSELALRFPSVIYGLLTVYVTYLIAKKISGNDGNLFSKLSFVLIATSPFHIYYSQEARMYSLTAFLATFSVYSYLFVLDDKKSKYSWWLIFSFSIAALVFTDYPAVFLLPVLWLYGKFVKKKRAWWKKFVQSHLPLIFLGILWLPTFNIQTTKGSWLLETLPAWKQVAGGANFKQVALVWMKFVLGRISFVNKTFYYLLIGAASIPFLFSIGKSLLSKDKNILMWMWLVVPLTLGFLASFIAPIFIYFRFLYVIPAFYLVTARGITLVPSKSVRQVMVGLLIAVNISGWLFYVLGPQQKREQWGQATKFVESKISESDVVIFDYPQPFSPYRWYSEKPAQARGVTNSISADSVKTAEITKQTIKEKNGVYYFEYLRDLSDPQRVVEKTLAEEDFIVSRVYNDFYGVGQIFYYIKDVY